MMMVGVVFFRHGIVVARSGSSQAAATQNAADPAYLRKERHVTGGPTVWLSPDFNLNTFAIACAVSFLVSTEISTFQFRYDISSRDGSLVPPRRVRGDDDIVDRARPVANRFAHTD